MFPRNSAEPLICAEPDSVTVPLVTFIPPTTVRPLLIVVPDCKEVVPLATVRPPFTVAPAFKTDVPPETVRPPFDIDCPPLTVTVERASVEGIVGVPAGGG